MSFRQGKDPQGIQSPTDLHCESAVYPIGVDEGRGLLVLDRRISLKSNAGSP
jgi:hypothetical protein